MSKELSVLTIVKTVKRFQRWEFVVPYPLIIRIDFSNDY